MREEEIERPRGQIQKMGEGRQHWIGSGVEGRKEKKKQRGRIRERTR